MMKNYQLFISLVFILILSGSCKELEHTWQYQEVNQAQAQKDSLDTPTVLKAHMPNGHLYFFPRNWIVDTNEAFLFGYALHYDENRDLIEKTDIHLSIDSVVLFEVNKELDLTIGHTMLAPLTIVNTAIGLICLTNPKACFGSCPTFYLPEDQGLFSCRAEGFSNAIAPSLAYGDWDDLKVPQFQDSVFRLVMKNEAQETHVLKDIKLYALPVRPGEEVYQSRENRFYTAKDLYTPLNNELLKEADQQEYFSEANAKNLASSEEIILDFELGEDSINMALVLDFRQTLMTTYFIYSAMGYMGNEVGRFFSSFESSGDLYEIMDKGLKSELGELEIYLWDEHHQEWLYRGAFYETGPIAVNRQILNLEAKGNREVSIKLKMNHGLWRVDRAALVHLKTEVEPKVYSVSQVAKNGQTSNRDLKKLLGAKTQMISMPGDQFQLDFNLNEEEAYALFLYAEGYYLEWMRDAWLSDKDLRKLRQMFKDPARYLKNEAAAYKIYEQTMEEVFWSSQVAPKPLSTRP